MKQTAFDNIIKVAFLLMVGYFLFLMTKMSEPRDSADGGRYKFIDEQDGLILDSKTGYLYDAEKRKK